MLDFVLLLYIHRLKSESNISSPFELKPVLRLRKIEKSPLLWTCEILGAQRKISIKKLRFLYNLYAKVRRQTSRLQYFIINFLKNFFPIFQLAPQVAIAILGGSGMMRKENNCNEIKIKKM